MVRTAIPGATGVGSAGSPRIQGAQPVEGRIAKESPKTNIFQSISRALSVPLRILEQEKIERIDQEKKDRKRKKEELEKRKLTVAQEASLAQIRAGVKPVENPYESDEQLGKAFADKRDEMIGLNAKFQAKQLISQHMQEGLDNADLDVFNRYDSEYKALTEGIQDGTRKAEAEDYIRTMQLENTNAIRADIETKKVKNEVRTLKASLDETENNVFTDLSYGRAPAEEDLSLLKQQGEVLKGLDREAYEREIDSFHKDMRLSYARGYFLNNPEPEFIDDILSGKLKYYDYVEERERRLTLSPREAKTLRAEFNQQIKNANTEIDTTKKSLVLRAKYLAESIASGATTDDNVATTMRAEILDSDLPEDIADNMLGMLSESENIRTNVATSLKSNDISDITRTQAKLGVDMINLQKVESDMSADELKLNEFRKAYTSAAFKRLTTLSRKEKILKQLGSQLDCLV